MSQDDLAKKFEEQLKQMGMIAQIVSASPQATEFDDGEVIARVGPLLLRLSRDRGEEFLDIGTASQAGRFHQFDDVELAMGWTTLEKVLAKREPEPMPSVLAKLRCRLGELSSAFEGERAPLTLKRVEEAARKRGEAVVARLR